ncbi:MAG: hypothetical protein EAX86_08005 [Candidatus Heimdallarchaeota archaeon]|nr:hypothetical protein [Candidatus Heimdallarchaeota archaeon]
MDGYETELDEEMTRLAFQMSHEPISVKFIQEFSGFSFEGIKIPLTPRGSRISIPHFIAIYLAEKDIIEDFTEEYPLSLQSLTNAVRNEIRSGDLQQIHPYLHLLAKEYLLSELQIESSYSELELKRQRAKFYQLTKERLSKLVKMADNKNLLSKKRTDLTASERILFQKIANWVQCWKNVYIKR